MRQKILGNFLLVLLMLSIYGVANADVAQAQSSSPPVQNVTNVNSQDNNNGRKPLVRAIMANPPHFCPEEKDLKKNGLWWSTIDGNWRCYSQSFSTSIDSFIGAQWVGVKVGKIICMYRGKGGMDFPIALEQVHVAAILEPGGAGWSALVHGYKFCKSTNVADCPFYVKPKTPTEQIYKQIKYVGGIQDDNGNND